MQRRTVLASGAALIGGLSLLNQGVAMSAQDLTSSRFTPLNKSKSDWKSILDSDRYGVLFEENTERAGTSPLNSEKRDGSYICAACYLPLFKAEWKYESGTGWPSFFEKIDGHIATKSDRKLWMQRTEHHCARCGGHQGHVFTDGPQPTGLRYCNNGLAILFVPTDEALPPLRG